jgi:apolipoprotein N-acyltransferase
MERNSLLRLILCQLALTVLAAVLFALAFPNIIFENGLPFLAFIAYIPILVIIHGNGILRCAGWGAIYGYAAYGLFNYWLTVFHPLAGIIVGLIYLVYFAFLFTILKLALLYFPKRGYLVQWLIWLAYEYLRTKGFLGYSYGITGYAFWRITPLIQIAGITGVWGVSALVTFPSFWLYRAIISMKTEGKLKNPGGAIAGAFNDEKIPLILWAAVFIAALIFGLTKTQDFSDYPQADIALIQHNTDPWAASKAPSAWQIYEEYRNDLTILKRLSDEALAANGNIDMVIWPETAFVPRIYWHETYRDDHESWLLVKELLDYLSGKNTAFIIGNDDARRDPVKNPNPVEKHRIDYNAALHFEKGKIINIYRKLHLVPFTEHFPYKKQLPFIYNALEKADTHFWEKGGNVTVFKVKNFTFSTPVCFEDTFGYLCGNFVRGGADILVNMSNDAWSKSLSAQNQHLSMAVFRTVENYRSMVRSSVSGQTCAIDPCGRIKAMAPPFTQSYLNVKVPLVKGETLYTRYGDYLGILFVFAAAAMLLLGFIRDKIKK